MKQLAEFVPIALFFIVYQLNGQSISLAGWDVPVRWHLLGHRSADGRPLCCRCSSPLH